MSFLLWFAAAYAAADAPEITTDTQVTAGVLVPVRGSGTLPIGGISAGARLNEHQAVRFRLLGAPLSGAYSDDLDAPVAWGAAVEWEHRWALHGGPRPFWTASGGFAVVHPSADRPQVHPALHTGLGFAWSLNAANETPRWTVAPVIGLSPRFLSEEDLLSLVGPTLEIRLGRGP